MARDQKLNPYAGTILDEPIVWELDPRSSLLAPRTEEELAAKKLETDKQNFIQVIERYAALFRHYGMEPSDEGAEIGLILALARAHVPGFQVVFPDALRQEESRSRWTFERLSKLIGDIGDQLDAQQKAQNRTNLLEACRHVARTELGHRAARKDIETRARALKKQYELVRKRGYERNSNPRAAPFLGLILGILEEQPKRLEAAKLRAKRSVS